MTPFRERLNAYTRTIACGAYWFWTNNNVKQYNDDGMGHAPRANAIA